MKYSAIWHQIKTAPNRTAEVVVHESIAETLTQGVKRTKSADNVTRSSVGLIPYSKLVVKQELLSDRTRQVKITFTLLYDTRL
jgi:hypothetical protein